MSKGRENMSTPLETLIATLENVLRNTLDPPADPAHASDAIDRELAAPARQTRVISLRDTDVMAAFRDELSDGLIRADTVNRVLQLVNDIVMKML
jgi:hypothetical protein